MSERFGPNFAQRSIRAPAVHTIGLQAPSFIPRPKPRNQGNEGQPGCTHTERAHTLSATETQHNSQPETPKGSWPLLLPRRCHRRRRRRRCCCCCCRAAAVLLLLLDPRCIAEHNPSQQTVSRFVFYGTRAGASHGAAAAAAVVATAAAAEQQQQQVQQQGRPKHTYEYTTRHESG